MATYWIEAGPETIVGAFDRDIPPLLTIDSGDTVVYSTLDDAGWLEPPRRDGQPRRQHVMRDPAWEAGHPLCGPVAIRGAEPGMTLAIQIGEIVPGSFGYSSGGGWTESVMERRLGIADREVVLDWEIDREALTARNQFGWEVTLRPFMGVMGMPPAEPGRHATQPPRPTGGNLDFKELVSGSTLYLPIAVPGGLFLVGDGHAVQGDGEISATGIECPMERVELTFELLPDLRLTTPRARNQDGWFTLGIAPDLDEAAAVATEEMIRLLGECYGMDAYHAFAMASLAVDLRITQNVNPARGVHAFLAHEAIRMSGGTPPAG
jgi:acetamidase/formamidase